MNAWLSALIALLTLLAGLFGGAKVAHHKRTPKPPKPRPRRCRRKPKPTKWVTVMYDSVTASEIPKRAPAAACYIDGRYANRAAVEARKPRRLITITVFGAQGANAGDCEPGDMDPQHLAVWARAEVLAGQRPWCYTSISEAPAMLAALAEHGVRQHQIYLWSAHYTGWPHVCGPHTCGYSNVVADATQWTDRAQGRNLDQTEIRPGVLA